jgi:hypothetical protein
MRVHLTELAIGSLVVALSSSAASADPIRLIREARFVSAQAFVFNSDGFVGDSAREQQVNGDTLSASAHAVHGGTTTRSQGQLVSAMSADLHRLSGAANASTAITGPAGDGSATSIFEVWFELDAPHAYDFAANFEAFGLGGWQTHLVRSPGELGQSLLFAFISNTGPTLQLNRGGSLDPGRYALAVRSGGFASTMFGVGTSGRSNVDFVFDMTPVPEPTSIVLVGGGILGAIVRAQRRTRARRAPAGNA